MTRAFIPSDKDSHARDKRCLANVRPAAANAVMGASSWNSMPPAFGSTYAYAGVHIPAAIAIAQHTLDGNRITPQRIRIQLSGFAYSALAVTYHPTSYRSRLSRFPGYFFSDCKIHRAAQHGGIKHASLRHPGRKRKRSGIGTDMMLQRIKYSTINNARNAHDCRRVNATSAAPVRFAICYLYVTRDPDGG